ncbi:MAG: PQQ-binding-like beta-propeller repeat protein [Phycisphaerales bacterium]|nr:PQQ-binding-like beta-propeller repeat protein [Phycisphaerales bacterium]
MFKAGALGLLSVCALTVWLNRQTDWAGFRGNAQLTGVATTTLPSKLAVAWRFETEDHESVTSTAAIARSTVYFGSENGVLYALQLSDGKVRWKYKTDEAAIQSSPAVAAGIVYFGDGNGEFHAVDAATGKKRWSYRTEAEIISSANVLGDRVLFGSYDGRLYCLAAKDGKEIWKIETEQPIHGTPGIADNSAFFAGCDGRLRVVRISDGKQLQDLDVGAQSAASVAVQASNLYLGTLGNRVLCIDRAKGQVKWTYEHPDRAFPFHSSPAVTDKVVVIGGRDKYVHALNPATGKARWVFQTRGRVDSSPVIVDDRVFVGSADGNLYGIDLARGKEIWRFEAGGSMSASPAVGNGRLVIGTEDGIVYCFGEKSAGD